MEEDFSMTCNLKTKLVACLVVGILTLALSAPVFSSEIIFEGKNPGIFSSAPPNGISALMNSVVRPEDPAIDAGALDPAELIQRGILSKVSTEINDQIFDVNNASGSYDLGGGNLVSFIRAGGDLIITIVNVQTGTTVITLPDL